MANGDKSSYMEHLVRELIKRNWPQAADRKGATNQNHPKTKVCQCAQEESWNASGLKNWVVISNIFDFHHYLGKWSNLTSIFFKWVGSTTN